MKTKMEKTINRVVRNIAKNGGSRKDVCRAASIALDARHNINCAEDGSNAGDYLVVALDKYFNT